MIDPVSRYMDKYMLGVDFGEAQTGIAMGKNGVVSPVKQVESTDWMTIAQQIMRLAKQNKAEGIIMGLPLTLDQKETPQSMQVRKFSKILKTRLGIPVIFVNEYGTSREAMAQAIEGELPQRARRNIDSISASIILKRFFTEEGWD